MSTDLISPVRCPLVDLQLSKPQARYLCRGRDCDRFRHGRRDESAAGRLCLAGGWSWLLTAVGRRDESRSLPAAGNTAVAKASTKIRAPVKDTGESGDFFSVSSRTAGSIPAIGIVAGSASEIQ
jgi:hypothetical protein